LEEDQLYKHCSFRICRAENPLKPITVASLLMDSDFDAVVRNMANQPCYMSVTQNCPYYESLILATGHVCPVIHHTPPTDKL
jgi:hypothetical protein